MSSPARRINKILKSMRLNYTTEKTFDNLIGLKGGNLRFDFAVTNKEGILLLIEYDGEHHFKESNPDKEQYEYIKHHDNLKNKYCEHNDIPLLRIPTKDKKNIKTLLIKFLLEHEVINNNDRVVIKEFNRLNEKIKKNNYKIEKLKETIMKLERENELTNKLKGEMNK